MNLRCVFAWKYLVHFSILFLLCIKIEVDGQPKCKVEYYSTEQGLSHQRVTVMLKDREGFMWFGSWDGINRFDGHSFVSYKSSPGDLSQLSNDRIDQIVEDQSNHLWIQSYDKQVYRFDKKNHEFLPLSSIISLPGKRKIAFNKILTASNGLVWLASEEAGLFSISQNNLSKGDFTQFAKERSGDYRLPSNTFNFFHEDLEHNVWVGTPNGLSCLVPSALGGYKINNSISGSIATGVNVMAIDEDAGQLYFSTDKGNLIIYNKKVRSFSTRRITTSHLNAFLRSRINDVIYFTTSAGDLLVYSPKTQQISKINFRPNQQLNSMYEDKKGNLWIEPEELGAVRFNPSNHSFHYFSAKSNEGLNTIGNRFKILEDNNNTVWVNMKGGGFGFYDEETNSLDYFLSTPDATKYELPKLLYNIYYDNTGILWLSTYEKELVKIILQVNDFKQQLLVQPVVSASDNEVRGVFYDNKNRLWLGAKSGKLHVYEKNKSITGLFDNEPKEGLGLVYSILQDRHKNIWLGTKGRGLYKAVPINRDETKYHLIHFLPDKNNPNSISGKDIYALLEDQKGRIWIGTFDEGLNFVKEDRDTIKFIHTGNAFKDYPRGSHNKIRHLAQDSEGFIWIATTDGLLLLNANDERTGLYQYKLFRKIQGDKESLGNNNIQFVYRDLKNRMWLGTSGGGLSLAIGDKPFQSLRFRNYTTKDGMPNDYVLSFAEDKQGNLWIATENGLSKFKPETGTFRNYDSYDGLPKLSFSEASACHQLPNGLLIFGTTKGYLSFDPKNISSNPIRANIALTNLRINNKDAKPGEDESVLNTDINYLSELRLKYNQNIISIDYAILDNRAGNRQAFAYRLVGFDTTWRDDRQFRRATYTNLSPGHYVFEVKSLSTDLYSNHPYRRLAVTILPPPWKTWWAYLLYACFTVLVLYFIRRYAVAMIRLRNKIAVEQKLAALKLNFFTNVSHELRTPLTLIINPLEQLSKKEDLSPEGETYLDIAQKNANRMIRFVNQLLDLRKVESNKATLRISRVEIVNFVRIIGDHFNAAARSKRIRFDILSDQKEVMAWVDPEKLDVVIYNLIGNAIKFTPEGRSIKVVIRSIPEEQSFSVAVCDQGSGVAKENLESIFQMFQEGNNSSRELKGTGIGLALSREFVTLHGGKIWAENNFEGGLTVTLKIKLGPEHYRRDAVTFAEFPGSAFVHEKPLEQQLLPKQYHSPAKDGQAPLVLLVEDNDELRSFIKGQLNEYYRVETARDGVEGLQKAKNLIPDLIVSDIMMPRMDGIQMLDKVKNDVETSHIPVVLLSAKYSLESQIEGLKYDADYYITKPFSNDFLVASIDNLLRQRKRLFETLVNKQKSVPLTPSPVIITSKDEIFLKEVIKAVEEKMDSPEFNIESLSVTMAMNSNTFYKKFKSLTGLTPVEFVRDMRLQRAKQLLDVGGNNVSQVAYSVGFSNPKYFSTCFKEKYHVSPSDYLKAKVI